jgi:deoxyribose-phosphate aldolase
MPRPYTLPHRSHRTGCLPEKDTIVYKDTPHAAAAELVPAELASQSRAQFATADALAAMLDHTLLKPEATREQAATLAAEAAQYRFACAMVNPAWVPVVRDVLAGTGIRVGTVLGFPLGASMTDTKCAEARYAAQAGALDLDTVIHIGALRSGLYSDVEHEIHSIAEVAHGEGAILKVILETCLLTDEEKRKSAEMCVHAGADFVKTSTGFSTGGATVADVRLLRATVGERCGVKASGGIRSLSDAVRMAQAGANRIGASASVAIVEAWKALA